MVSQCVITLGGEGSRFKEISSFVPKPLYPINGVSTLERSVCFLSGFGISNFIFLCGYRAFDFEPYARKLEQVYSVSITIYTEQVPMGESGALFKVTHLLEDAFLFLNGDIIFNLDVKRLLCFHSDVFSDITLVTHFSTHPYDSDCILEDPSGLIQVYKTKNDRRLDSGCYLGNAGLAVIKKSTIERLMPLGETLSRPDLFSGLVILAIHHGMKVASYNTTEYLKDMGTPSRFNEVSAALLSGLVDRLSYVNTQRALFVDRDNTIVACPNGSYLCDASHINLIIDNVKRLAVVAADFDFVICISNQPQVSMGLCSSRDVNIINGLIAEKCIQYGLMISAFYYCPHHPDAGYDGEIKELKERCFCRKPNPGLVLRAAFERNINLSESMFVGDSWRDREIALRLGIPYQDVYQL